MSSEPYTGPGFSLHVTLYIDPAQLDAFFEAFKPAYEAVTAEPENVFFEVYQDPHVPGKLKLVENWNASLEWLTTVRIKSLCYLSSWNWELAKSAIVNGEFVH